MTYICSRSGVTKKTLPQWSISLQYFVDILVVEQGLVTSFNPKDTSSVARNEAVLGRNTLPIGDGKYILSPLIALYWIMTCLGWPFILWTKSGLICLPAISIYLDTLSNLSSQTQSQVWGAGKSLTQ